MTVLGIEIQVETEIEFEIASEIASEITFSSVHGFYSLTLRGSRGYANMGSGLTFCAQDVLRRSSTTS